MTFAVNDRSLAESVLPIAETAAPASSLIAGWTGGAVSAARAIGNAAHPTRTPSAAD